VMPYGGNTGDKGDAIWLMPKHTFTRFTQLT